MGYQLWTIKEPPRTKVVEVFKTNIINQHQAIKLISLLNKEFPSFRINVDLSDCDNILRVEGYQVFPERVMELVARAGFECLVLE